MAIAAKRKRVNELNKFFQHHDGYFICEIDGGSSCGVKISVNQGQVTNKMRHNNAPKRKITIKTCLSRS